MNWMQDTAVRFAVWSLSKVGLQEKAMSLGDLFISGGEHPAFDTMAGGKGNAKAINYTKDGYSSSWIAYACISNMATDIAGVPVVVLRDPKDPESEVPDSDPVRRLFDTPMPSLSTSQFIEFIFLYRNLRGASFVVFDNPDSPTRMIPFRDPLFWAGKQTEDEGLGQWVFRRGKRHDKYLPSEVIASRLLDPASPWGWQSPLVAASAALEIDSYGNRLKSAAYRDGGGQPPEFKTDKPLLEPKIKQLKERITESRDRRMRGIADPLILSDGMDRVDPRFTMQDLRILENQKMSAEQITAIYKMSPSLIWREDEANRDTMLIRQRKYWTENLIPQMRSQEHAFDSYFLDRFGVYVRFNWTNVEALQADEGEQIEKAQGLHKMNVPLTEINRRLDMSLDVDSIPWADESFVNINTVPISMLLDGVDLNKSGAVKESRANGGSSPAVSDAPAPVSAPFTELDPDEFRALMISRANDPGARIEQNKARLALGDRLTKGWRRIAVRLRSEAVDVANKWDGSTSKLKSGFSKLVEPAEEKIEDLATPVLRQAGVEGVISILDLVAEDDEERMYRTGRAEYFRDDPTLPKEAAAIIRRRTDYIKGMPERSFEAIMGVVERAVLEDDGPTAQDIADAVRRVFNVEVNKAVTIGRTEVGHAFNASRFGQMKAQDFEKHEWLTAGDELVRGNEGDDAFDHTSSNGKVRKIGKKFPCGLKYPQEDGGEAGNVINCRCLTIPSK
jgi:phage portal protein BeeE